MPQVNQLYRVKNSHKFFPNRVGKFKFVSGLDHTIAVLSNLTNDEIMFAVKITDITPHQELVGIPQDFRAELNEKIIK